MFFAWTGCMIWTLIPLAIFGVAAFIYGLNQLSSSATDITSRIAATFDNNITPWVALFLCVWSRSEPLSHVS